MFKIATEPTFTHEVKARVPVDGGFTEETFKATFRVIDPAEADNYDLMTTAGASALLRRVVVKLHDIADAAGNPREYSDQVLEDVLKLPWARAGLARTYFGAVAGAKAGN